MAIKKPVVSSTRFHAREAERKLMPAIKALSTSIHNTGATTNDFVGYKCPAGSVIDNSGRKWQYQIFCVVAPDKFIRKDEIVPLIRKWAIGVRIKAFVKYVIDWSSK